MSRRAVVFAGAMLLVLAGCHRREVRPVEALRGNRDVSRFALTSIKGTRDGDRLHVLAEFGEGLGGHIEVDLRFTVGVPTGLKSGTWVGLGGNGAVKERSVTFLGGQSGPPSIGGQFDLVATDGLAQYRINIPLKELKNKY